MSKDSNIDWTESTWNPVTGCDKISAGCKNCYAERMSLRLMSMPNQPNYQNGFKVTLHPHMLDKPLHWKKPQRIFVNSMSDLFHKDVPDGFIRDVFNTMVKAHWHQFQVLTKRSDRLKQLAPTLPWSPNIWIGVSIESSNHVSRADDLRYVPAVVRFLSLEPLLSPLPNLDLSGIDWVIVGGESGPGCRPMAEAWVQDIRANCNSTNVPFFFKQWGGTSKSKGGNVLSGQTYGEYPTPNYQVLGERTLQLSGLWA